MARRTFTVVDVTEILVHWYAGRPISEVALSLGVDRKTVRNYLAPAITAGLRPGGARCRVPTGRSWSQVGSQGWPTPGCDRSPGPRSAAITSSSSSCWPPGVTQATIHQRLRDEHGLAASVASLRRYVAAMLPEELRRDRVTELRDDPPPGQEALLRLAEGRARRAAKWSRCPFRVERTTQSDQP
jgi:hypothetical protein